MTRHCHELTRECVVECLCVSSRQVHGDPAWRAMICVETGNIADNEVRLAQNGAHQTSMAISVETGA